MVKGLQEDRVLIGDPAQGTRAVSRKSFEESWKNGLLFVIHNRRNLAVFNSPNDWKVAPLAPLKLARTVILLAPFCSSNTVPSADYPPSTAVPKRFPLLSSTRAPCWGKAPLL